MRHFYLPRYTHRLLFKLLIAAVLTLANIQVSAQQYQSIKAKKGDGIYSILKQYGYPPHEYLNEFIELNKSKLGKGNTLITGRIYRLPFNRNKAPEPVKTPAIIEKKEVKAIFEIFGSKYREVTIKNKELSGAVFYLMSGHGGPDPGAIGVLDGHKLCEDEYAYDVTLRLARNLIECGASVYMIIRDSNDGIRDEQFLLPDKDEVCYLNNVIPLNQLARLRQSTNAVNKLHAVNKDRFERLIIIHVDSRSTKENIDVFFYHNKASNTGKRLANTLQQTFEKKYALHQPNRGYNGSIYERNLYVLRNSLVPSVFIELGNINHTRDQKRFIISDNRQAVSNWLREGLIEDFRKTIK